MDNAWVRSHAQLTWLHFVTVSHENCSLKRNFERFRIMSFAKYRPFCLIVALSTSAIGLTVSFAQNVRRKPDLVPVPVSKTTAKTSAPKPHPNLNRSSVAPKSQPANATKTVGATAKANATAKATATAKVAKPAANVQPVAKVEDAGAKFYDSQAMPILKKNCLHCHEGDKPKGKLRLNSREAILAGGNSGPAVDLVKTKDSLLVQAINYQDIEMPPSGKMAQGDIDTLTKWVEMGLPWSNSADGAAVAHHGPPQVNDENKKFWAFQPVKAPKVPTVKNTAWISNPIDNFVLAKLEAKGLQPAQRADKLSLLRRATYDLLGLPPTPEQVRAFVNDR